MSLDLVINICKPPGITSFDVVSRVRRMLGLRKVGHCGTLDPFAQGVLVICTGKATRVSEYLMHRPKVYEALVRFGQRSSTGDPEGEIIAQADASMVTREALQTILPAFTGEIMQRPHRVSAVKVQGQRLYKLARKGVEVEAQERQVTIHHLEILWVTGENPAPFGDRISPEAILEADSTGFRDALISVGCSSGTYIRSLGEDMGEALGTLALVKTLTRTAVGEFTLDQSFTPLDWKERICPEQIPEQARRDIGQALCFMPALSCLHTAVPLISNGGPLYISQLAPGRADDADPSELEQGCMVRIVDENGDLLALHQAQTGEGGQLTRPRKVLAGLEA